MSANDPQHRVGESVDTVDQTGSLALLGVAIVGGVTAVPLIGYFVHP